MELDYSRVHQFQPCKEPGNLGVIAQRGLLWQLLVKAIVCFDDLAVVHIVGRM